MDLRFARATFDCAGSVVEGGAKNSGPYIVICPTLTFYRNKVGSGCTKQSVSILFKTKYIKINYSGVISGGRLSNFEPTKRT